MMGLLLGGGITLPFVVGLLEGAPGEHGAFDALRKFADPAKGHQIAQGLGLVSRFLGDELSEVAQHLQGLRSGSALELECHQGSRGLADGAALPGELQFYHFPHGIKVGVKMDFVATRGVVGIDMDGGFGKFAKVAGTFGMLQEHGLIKFVEIVGHDCNVRKNIFVPG